MIKWVNPEEHVFSRLVYSNLSMRLTSLIAVKVFNKFIFGDRYHERKALNLN